MGLPDSSSKAMARARAGWALPFRPSRSTRIPASLITASAISACPTGMSFGRLADRSQLLETVDGQARQLEAIAEIHALSGHYRRAYDLLANRKAIEAFDLNREDPRLRDRYGWNAHGQSVLQARRLVEAGVPLVTAFWPNEGLTNVERLLGHA